MISQDVVLVRYGEITLKDSWTRQNWERILAGNIAFSLHRAGVEHKMSRGEGRIFVHTSDPRASEIAARVFGVVSTSPARTVASDLEEISQAAVELALRQSRHLLPFGPGAPGYHSPANRSGGSWARPFDWPRAPPWTWMSRSWRSSSRPERTGPTSSPRS